MILNKLFGKVETEEVLGSVYEVMEQNDVCAGCHFEDVYNGTCLKTKCMPDEREDGRGVIFKELKMGNL